MGQSMTNQPITNILVALEFFKRAERRWYAFEVRDKILQLTSDRGIANFFVDRFTNESALWYREDIILELEKMEKRLHE